MRRRNTAVVAIVASLLALGAARADPLTIRSGWVVMTSGYTPMVLEAKDQLKHYGSSYILEDLKGHVVATNGIGGAFDGGMRMMLRKHGLEDKRDFSVVESDYTDMSAMLLSKKVDLSIGAQPGVSEPTFRAATHPLFTMRDATGGRTQVLVFAARAGFLEKNRAALVDFFTDMLALSRWFHDPAHRPEAIALAARVTKQPYERLDSYLFSKSDFYSDPNGMPDVAALQSGIDMMVALGFAKERIDVKRYLDLSLVQEAAKRLP